MATSLPVNQRQVRVTWCFAATFFVASTAAWIAVFTNGSTSLAWAVTLGVSAVGFNAIAIAFFWLLVMHYRATIRRGGA